MQACIVTQGPNMSIVHVQEASTRTDCTASLFSNCTGMLQLLYRGSHTCYEVRAVLVQLKR